MLSGASSWMSKGGVVLIQFNGFSLIFLILEGQQILNGKDDYWL